MGRLEALEAIMNSVKSTMSMDAEFEFMCYTDFIFVYGIYDNNKYYELNIICDDTMIKEMSIRDLINIGGMTYVSYAIHTIHDDNSIGRNSEKVASWSANDETSLN